MVPLGAAVGLEDSFQLKQCGLGPVKSESGPGLNEGIGVWPAQQARDPCLLERGQHVRCVEHREDRFSEAASAHGPCKRRIGVKPLLRRQLVVPLLRREAIGVEAVREELEEPRPRPGKAEIPRISLPRIVVKSPPDVVGVRPVDTLLSVDESVEPTVLLDQTQFPFAQRA